MDLKRDLADPFDRGMEAYRATYDLLRPRVEALLEEAAAAAGS